MTTNQIKYWELQETKRANREKEKENVRSHMASESETQRANLAKEAIQSATHMETVRHNASTEFETHRANVADESERTRHNLMSEIIQNSYNQGSLDVQRRKVAVEEDIAPSTKFSNISKGVEGITHSAKNIVDVAQDLFGLVAP